MPDDEGREAAQKDRDSILVPMRRNYAILGVSPGASKEEITEAYKKRLAGWAPDNFGDDAMRNKAGRMAAQIDKAYESIILFLSQPGSGYMPLGISLPGGEETLPPEAKPEPVASRKKISRLTSWPVLVSLAVFFLVVGFGTHKIFFAKEPPPETVSEPVSEEAQWISKGDELKASKKYSAAVEAYTKALELNPGNPEAYYNRAIAYSLTGKHQEFIQDCRDAARLGNRDAIEVLNNHNIRY